MFDRASLEQFLAVEGDHIKSMVADELVAAGMDLNRWVQWYLENMENIPEDRYGVEANEMGWRVVAPRDEFTHTDDHRAFTALVQAQLMDVFPEVAKAFVNEFKRRMIRNV